VRFAIQVVCASAHQAPAIPDPLAAAAVLGGLTVLALDEDLDPIAQITGQSVEMERLRI
jgi:hypothetical protein